MANDLVAITLTEDHAGHKAGSTLKVSPYIAGKLQRAKIAEAVEPASRKGGRSSAPAES